MDRTDEKSGGIGIASILGKLPRETVVFAVCALAMAANLCLLLCNVWSTRMDYSFGYLVPIFVAYVIWDRKERISGYFAPSREAAKAYVPSRLTTFVDFISGAVFLFFCCVYIFFAWVYYITQYPGPFVFTMTWSFSAITLCMVFFSSKADLAGNIKPLGERLRLVGIFAFPCLIWMLASPLPGAFEERVSLFLLSLVSNIVYNVMDWLGYVVSLKGRVIEFPGGSVGVAEACSGIRSLTACLFAGSFLAAVMLDKLWKKVCLVLLSMFFAFFANLIRAFFLSFWAYENGSESISGTVHDTAGYVVLAITVAGLLIFVALFQINPVPKEFRDNK